MKAIDKDKPVVLQKDLQDKDMPVSNENSNKTLNLDTLSVDKTINNNDKDSSTLKSSALSVDKTKKQLEDNNNKNDKDASR